LDHYDYLKKRAAVVVKAWKDPSFKARLLKDPAPVLKEAGFEIPSGVKVHAHETSHDTYHFVLPPKPKGVKDEKLSHRVPIVADMSCPSTTGACDGD